MNLARGYFKMAAGQARLVSPLRPEYVQSAPVPSLPDQSHIHLIATMIILCNNNTIVLSRFHYQKKTKLNPVVNGVTRELTLGALDSLSICLIFYSWK